jgi:hypothetical protein
MNDNDFDVLLHREIADGKEFENLIPKSNCTKTKSGQGTTDFSMKEIEFMSNEYSWQLEKIAKILKASSLIDSIANVKDFIYSHFQYKADKDDQLLRSPACAWFDRYNGIDCKTYSILASSLLAEMGYIHYIRRIKQPAFEPTEWTHVYVVVPINQKTGDLQNGYYTIDGTLSENSEPLFVEKDDLIMSLTHYRLNAPASGLGIGIGTFNFNSLSLNNITSLIACLQPSAYGNNEYKRTVANIDKYFGKLFEEINLAVQNNDKEEFALLINEFYGNSFIFLQGAEISLAEGWNACSTNNMKLTIQVFKNYKTVVGQALKAWLDDNFTVDTSIPVTNITYNGSSQYWIKYGFDLASSLVNKQEPLIHYNPKNKQIPVFEITQYLANVTSNPSTFNALQFLSGLTKVLASFDSSIDNPNENPNIDYTTNQPTQPTQMGFGVGGWLVLAVGVTWLATGGFKGMTN